jgi:hypothetical protein
MLGFKTIRKGERAAIWYINGKVKMVDGPKMLLLYNQKIDMLKLFTAEPDEYISIKYKDGRKQNLRGPVSVWFDPVAHNFIAVEKLINIEENEALVVYVQKDGSDVKRKIIKGPDLYMPSENEWTHEFRWHGADPFKPCKKIPRGLIFNKLRTIPDQMYFDVEDVRTSDDALVIIKVMIFFEIMDLNTMLAQTHDPVADFINALTADTIDFVSGLTFEEFKENTHRLNSLETYKQLVLRAERIGYRINKVVYRGYTSSPRLQEMHNNAIEARTKLKLEAETEEQSQEIADLKLERELDRSIKRREMEESEVRHENQLARLAHDEKLREEKAELEARIEEIRLKNKTELENKGALNKEEETFLATIQKMNVDLTKYLVAQYQVPDKLIRIEGEKKAQLHVHD